MSRETILQGQETNQIQMGNMFAGALEDAQALLRKHLALVSKLMATERFGEAEVALRKAERHAAGVLSCLNKGSKRDRAYKAMLEDDLDDLRRRLAASSRRARPTRFTKMQGLLLLVGAAVLIVLAAIALVP
jgi:hypothetical protein